MKGFVLVLTCLAPLSLAAPAGTAATLDPTVVRIQAEGDKKGVPDRCARIVNPAERRKCILSSGGG